MCFIFYLDSWIFLVTSSRFTEFHYFSYAPPEFFSVCLSLLTMQILPLPFFHFAPCLILKVRALGSPLVVVLLTTFSLSDDAILLQFLTFCDIHMIYHLF